MEEQGYWKRHWQRSLSRRRVLQGVALGGAGLAAAAVVGCGGEEEKPAATITAAPTGTARPATTPTQAGTPTPAAKQPKRGGTLVHAIGGTQLWSGYDPHILNQSFTGSMSFFYQSPLRRNPQTMEPEPLVAQKWEQPSPTEFIFRLAPGIKWHNKPPVNGRELTAQDVAFSLERVRTDDPRFFGRALLANVDKIEAVDKGAIRVTTKSPDVTVLANLADDNAAILAPEAVEKFGTGKFSTADTAIGTGAFILKSGDDISVTLARNPDYWRPGLPYLDGVRVQKILDPIARWAAFRAGQLDLINVPGEEVKNILPEQGKKYFLTWWKDHAPQYLWTNTRKQPFNDPRVYRSLRLLMDHDEMIKGWVEVWFGPGSGGYTSHLPHILDAWDFSQEEYKQARTPLFLEWKQPKDEAAREALALLSAAGFNKDNPLKFVQHSITDNLWAKALAELTQAQWRRLSQNVVQSELKLLDNPILNTNQARGEYEVAGPVARVVHFEVDQAFTLVNHSKGSVNYAKQSDPKLDELIEKQRQTFDRRQRQALVKEILTWLLQNSPYTSPCSRDQLWATQLKIQNFAAEPGSYPHGHQYDSVWLDA